MAAVAMSVLKHHDVDLQRLRHWQPLYRSPVLQVKRQKRMSTILLVSSIGHAENWVWMKTRAYHLMATLSENPFASFCTAMVEGFVVVWM